MFRRDVTVGIVVFGGSGSGCVFCGYVAGVFSCVPDLFVGWQDGGCGSIIDIFFGAAAACQSGSGKDKRQYKCECAFHSVTSKWFCFNGIISAADEFRQENMTIGADTER